MSDMTVYEYVPYETYENDPEGILVGTTWVETDKGTPEAPDPRMRLCAQEFADGKDPELYSSTPPLVATRLLISQAASTTSGREKRLMMALDVKRAFLHGQARRHLYIKLPKEDPRADGGHTIGRLLKSMYGTRDAPQIWAGEVKKTMEALGFRVCRINPCIFYHETWEMQVITHVDDFLCCGSRGGLEWFRDELQKSYEITGEILGEGRNDAQSMKFLKRTITLTPEGLTYEANPAYVQRLLEEWSMEDCSPVSTPGTKDRKSNEEASEPLPRDMEVKYKRAAATLNYLALDRPDIAFSSKELSRKMTNPEADDVVALKRLLRYLKGCPRLAWHFPWHVFARLGAPRCSQCLIDWLGDCLPMAQSAYVGYTGCLVWQ